MNLQSGILHCSIGDNRIESEKKTEKPEKLQNGKKSLGIELTRSRLELIDPSKRENVGITIDDLAADSGERAGTCVHIKIPVKEM